MINNMVCSICGKVLQSDEAKNLKFYKSQDSALKESYTYFCKECYKKIDDFRTNKRKQVLEVKNFTD